MGEGGRRGGQRDSEFRELSEEVKLLASRLDEGPGAKEHEWPPEAGKKWLLQGHLQKGLLTL